MSFCQEVSFPDGTTKNVREDSYGNAVICNGCEQCKPNYSEPTNPMQSANPACKRGDQTVYPSTSGTKFCHYFNKVGGCKLGTKCTFAHVKSPCKYGKKCKFGEQCDFGRWHDVS